MSEPSLKRTGPEHGGEDVLALLEGVVVLGAQGEVLTIHPRTALLLGLGGPNEGSADVGVQGLFRRCLSPSPPLQHVVGLSRPDGSRVWLSVSTLPITRPGADRPDHTVVYCCELPGPECPAYERPERETRGRQPTEWTPSTHDPLTGLPNRGHFRARLALALAEPGARFALCCLELNHFKLFNSELGHSVGDALLVQVAERLRSRVAWATELARFGGDEFMLLWPGVATDDEAEECVRTLQDLFAAPFHVGGHEVVLGVSVGIGRSPGPDLHPEATDADTLLGRAESAVWRVKTAGRQSAETSPELLSARLSERWQLESELRRALERDQLSVVYQPIVDAVSGRTVAAEALLRWRHPVLGELSPGRFIPVAEDAGLIHKLGGWVLNRSCQEAAGWPDGVRVAVNVSALQFERPDFLAGVEAALSQSGLSPDRLELELTESAVTRAPTQTAGRIRQLQELGVRVALDDFGTGYSNLGLLRHLSLSALKLDRSFVFDLEHDPRQRPLIRAIVQLGHALNLEVVAEGVESPAQRTILAGLGCNLLQGYGVALPRRALDLLSWPQAHPLP
jgi:diguanylate cyclase